MTPEQQIQEELDAMARARMNKRLAGLENALADARRDHAVLVRLVERMGEIVAILAARDDSLEQFASGDIDVSDLLSPAYEFTIIGQREYDAAMHEMEGPPPDAGMLEAVPPDAGMLEAVQ